MRCLDILRQRPKPHRVHHNPIMGNGHSLRPLVLRASTLLALTMDQPTVEFGGIYAVFLPDRHPAAKVRAFIDFIATRFAPEPPWDRDFASPDKGVVKTG
jgi:hypothetical protein